MSLRERIGAAAATVVLVAVLGYALMLGLAFRRAADPAPPPLATFAVTPDPPPPEPVVPPPHRFARQSGRAAPPNLRARATELVAPSIAVVPPPPLVVAPLPGPGTAANSGAAEHAGPGTGAGGTGDGHGAGGDGDGEGDGDGDGGGWERMPRLIRDRIKGSDIPDTVFDTGFHGVVGVRFRVGTDGRVTACTVTRSSGDISMDQATCRAIEKRFRYDPWRDAEGRPVPSTVLRNQRWDIDAPADDG